MKDFICGMMIGAACVFMWLNHTVGNHQEVMAGIECVEQERKAKTTPGTL